MTRLTMFAVGCGIGIRCRFSVCLLLPTLVITTLAAWTIFLACPFAEESASEGAESSVVLSEKQAIPADDKDDDDNGTPQPSGGDSDATCPTASELKLSPEMVESAGNDSVVPDGAVADDEVASEALSQESKLNAAGTVSTQFVWHFAVERHDVAVYAEFAPDDGTMNQLPWVCWSDCACIVSQTQ